MIERTFFPIGWDQQTPDLSHLKRELEARGRKEVALTFIPHPKGSQWRGTVEIASDRKEGWR